MVGAARKREGKEKYDAIVRKVWERLVINPHNEKKWANSTWVGEEQ